VLELGLCLSLLELGIRQNGIVGLLNLSLSAYSHSCVLQ